MCACTCVIPLVNMHGVAVVTLLSFLVLYAGENIRRF